MDKFEQVLDRYSEVLEHIDIMECPCFVFLDLPDDKLISSVDDLDNEEYSIKKEDEDLVEFTCSWPTYHRDIRELRTVGKYRVLYCTVGKYPHGTNGQ